MLPYYEKMTDSQIAAIRMYTGDTYGPINKVLRGYETYLGEKLRPEEKEFYQSMAEEMITALEQIPNAKKQKYYRGVGSSIRGSRVLKTYEKLKPGDIISDKSFSSFSADPETARNFLDPEVDNLLIINTSSRLKQVDIMAYANEEEHLSMPGERFRVKSNEVVEDRSFGKIRVVEIEDA